MKSKTGKKVILWAFFISSTPVFYLLYLSLRSGNFVPLMEIIIVGGALLLIDSNAGKYK